ncbi:MULTISPECIES: hemerythrin domain-containing protein [Thermomonospora]|uniref:Hemerythrin superfamily protein n=1 Tax=Thermomonospora cellulosilytica TaxID=1411118 RepID=A0A7W3MZD7_9ACTN|nr:MULTISPECIES: hemerythrin domain-containing protein [Thermomonospora]MBA9004688.1 hemerythrin superfamily protein [Thermomonospora cellulosilytica]
MASGQRDVIAVLTEDHREVARLCAEFEGLPASAAGRRREVVDQVIIELARHAAVEEEYLYPAVRRYVPDGDAIAEKEIADHAAMERAMKELEELEVDDARFDEAFARLAREVRMHVADEEGRLFPQLEAACDEETRIRLGARVERAKKFAPTRPHPVAPDKPPLNKLTDAGTGLLDRARDLISRRGR